MNELFNSHRQLNIKKIAIAIFVGLFLIIAFGDLFSSIFKSENTVSQDENQDAQNPNSIFYDSEKSISVELSKQYELTQYNSNDNNYLIELRSPNNLDIFISKIDLIENKTLKDVASADLHSFIENFQNYSNLSSLTEFNVNDKLTYTYSFHYLDNSDKTSYYLQIVWLETEQNYYIFDVEFPVNNMNNYTKLVNELLSSFNINNL